MSEKYIGSAILMDFAKYLYSVALLLRRLFRKPASFIFENQEYTYFEHPYNGTWMNERAVEIPLIWEFSSKYSFDRILEIGNVLSHYFKINHLVIDKYEKKKGIVSKDILDVELNRKFDCIVSISTLEHIGWDEIPQAPGKHILAVKKLRSLLSDDGILIATIPLGYNPSFDADIFDRRLEFDRVVFYKRIKTDVWTLASQEEVVGSNYGRSYRTTNGLAICIWKKG